MKKILTTLFILSTLLIFAQAPIVPKKMSFADMELTISNAARAEIQKSVNSLHRNPSYFKELLRKADLFFPIIEEEFEKKGCPKDIKYLCIQESGFKAEAVSSSNAVGYWQFKEATAVEQGLVVNRTVDERKNIVSSSKASAKYITAHNSSLDNWIYAIVAYNTGLGGVQKYYKSSYAGQKRVEITKKTHWYFLKFLAHKIAFQDFVGKSTPKETLKVYYKTSGKTIKSYAHEHKMSVDDLSVYNKWINPNKKIPTADRPFPVIVPIASESYAGNEGQEEKEDPVVKNTEPEISEPSPSDDEEIIPEYVKNAGENVKLTVNGLPAITAAEGDNADKLAIKGGITRVKFLKYNEIKSFEKLVKGQTYFLKKKRGKSKGATKHTTQYGETVWSISQRYGIKQSSLRRKNRMSKYETTQPGRVMWLKDIRPEDSEIVYKAVAKPKKEKKEVVVEKKQEKPKEVVKVIKKAEPVVDGPQPKYWHTVQPQEDLNMIAYYYLVDKTKVMEWNNLSSDNIKVGDRLKIMESSRDITIVKDTTKIETIEVADVVEDKIEPVVEKKAPVLESKTDNDIVRPSRFINVWVEPGTTLYGLSKQHNVSVDDIKKYNKLDGNTLSAGDKLAIPVYGEEVKEELGDRQYVVVAGDTFYSISRKLGITVDEIKSKNKKTDNSLTIGEILKY